MTFSKRPVHLLLRAPSACHASEMQMPHPAHAMGRPSSAHSSILSSSSAQSSEDSLFDVDSLRISPTSDGLLDDDGYFTDDTDFDNEPACLDLSDSGFTSVPVPLFAESDCLLQVQSLDLSSNPMDGANEEYLAENIHLPNLELLRLQSCQVSSLEPLIKHLRAPNLRELDISGHQLVGEVPHLQRYFPRLQTLIARRGSFEHLDEAAVAGLSFVDLSENLLGEPSSQLLDRCEELGTKLVL
jgi:Leucine-rich repeat (LRR) protein